ncbi:hypothetical protein CN238_08365 [Sinorhizobium meliloti]|nr:hypothetical protein CN238_08365 [Sinorhizobium meliloti]
MSHVGDLPFKGLYQSFSVLGRVVDVSGSEGCFVVRLLSGDHLLWRVSQTTWYEVLRNVGQDVQDRVTEPSPKLVDKELGPRKTEPGAGAWWDARRRLLKYLAPDRMICVQGILSENGATDKGHAARVYDARKVILMGSHAAECGWEQGHWWVHQIDALVEQWLDVLFQDRRELSENDFAQFYRTNLDIVGESTNNVTQECATLSRFLYGLSSAYLLTGNPRALSASKACASYLINAYADIREGRYCLWKFGRVRDGRSTRQILASLNPEDRGTYALYEQIYALSGLAQYYRVTQDIWVVSYINRTIESFQRYFLDTKAGHASNDPSYTGAGGYYSHIDYVTLRPDSPALDATNNRERKNWNSIGDHIPAYLVNLLLAIDPLPQSGQPSVWDEFRARCQGILEDCVEHILQHFKQNDGSVYVQERFRADWSADRSWGWQQDRAIIGHNLKICWNITRCGHYYSHLRSEAEHLRDADRVKKYSELASKCYTFSKDLGKAMCTAGVDLVRGGIFDAVERMPQNGMPIEFSWETTKDFWQQEQAILAYYIMHGIKEIPRAEETGESTSANGAGSDSTHLGSEPPLSSEPTFLELARSCAAFWNLFFIDQDNRRIFFRTTESGIPVITGQYGIQAGHAIAGYHAFELSYLAHIYIQSYVADSTRGSFSLFFRPVGGSSIKTLNVLPDFFHPGTVEIAGYRVNGLSQSVADPTCFQLDISQWPEASVYEVEFRRVDSTGRRTDPHRLKSNLEFHSAESISRQSVLPI